MRARRIAVDYAAHSPQVEAVRERAARRRSAGIEPQRQRASRSYSTVTGEPVDDRSRWTPSYWYRNLRQTVRFAEPVERAARATGTDAFIEVSPHPVLTFGAAGDARSGLGEPDGDRRDRAPCAATRAGPSASLGSLAEAHARGVAVDWEALFGPGAERVALPTYAFQRERYWLAAGAGAARPGGARPGRAPSTRCSAPRSTLADGEGALFTGRLSLAAPPLAGRPRRRRHRPAARHRLRRAGAARRRRRPAPGRSRS